MYDGPRGRPRPARPSARVAEPAACEPQAQLGASAGAAAVRGSPAGTSTTRCRPSCQGASWQSTRWPRCGGLKSAPNTPTRGIAQFIRSARSSLRARRAGLGRRRRLVAEAPVADADVVAAAAPALRSASISPTSSSHASSSCSGPRRRARDASPPPRGRRCAAAVVAQDPPGPGGPRARTVDQVVGELRLDLRAGGGRGGTSAATTPNSVPSQHGTPSPVAQERPTRSARRAPSRSTRRSAGAVAAGHGGAEAVDHGRSASGAEQVDLVEHDELRPLGQAGAVLESSWWIVAKRPARRPAPRRSAPGSSATTCSSARARSRWARNSWPSPTPCEAPSSRPGTSATVSWLPSADSTVPSGGARVVNG